MTGHETSVVAHVDVLTTGSTVICIMVTGIGYYLIGVAGNGAEKSQEWRIAPAVAVVSFTSVA